MESITINQIATAIALITAIISPVIALYKIYKKNISDKLDTLQKTIDQHEDEIRELKSTSEQNKTENILLIKSVQACLKGLKEKGCNGPVNEAIKNIDEYLLNASH